MTEEIFNNMVTHFKYVEELKLQITVLAAVFVLLFYVSFRKGRTKFCKLNIVYAVQGILLSLSMASILTLTILGREYQPNGRRFEWEWFWSYKRAVVGGSMEMGVEIFLNILLFVPWAVLMPMVYKRFESFGWMMLTGLCLSAGIELVQGVFCLGLFEFDDMFNNTLGTAIGWGIYRQYRDFLLSDAH